MIKALEERKKEREKAIQLAWAYLERLKRIACPIGAILYGSYARGDFHPGSDIDLLIITDDIPVHPLERLNLLYRYLEGEGVEPKALTQSEFSRMRRDSCSLASIALREGVILFLEESLLADRDTRRIKSEVS